MLFGKSFTPADFQKSLNLLGKNTDIATFQILNVEILAFLFIELERLSICIFINSHYSLSWA